ncbi:flavin reductase family protein [Serinibacter arcticus]|uniref:NADH-FMN oxidoreductase n=1 Tax=Serinibacter arcticus TaxID=1655435 RepID=A0A4Z1E245_9MICO|nr:flavin reductase family protein [Serinibacter arcticus]TGO05088.1 NADH-FMN oxidoreductase [Serinibacter arcticus]
MTTQTTPLTTPAPIAPAAFRELFRHHPNGVAVITTAGAHGPVGFTATSVVSISADPPLLAFSITDTSSSWPAVREASSVVVHLLDTRHRDLSQTFATSGINRFAQHAWRELPSGEPLLTDVGTWSRGTVVHRLGAGGSTVVLVEVTEVVTASEREPLVYHDRHYHSISPLSVVRPR